MAKSYLNDYQNKKEKLQKEFEETRYYMSSRKDTAFKTAMYESIFKEYTKYLYNTMEDKSRDVILRQVYSQMVLVMDKYPHELNASDWTGIYKNVSEMNLWDNGTAREKVKLAFLLNSKPIMDDSADEMQSSKSAADAANNTIDDDMANVDDTGTGTESLRHILQNKLSDKQKMYLEGYYDIAVNRIKGVCTDQWFTML